MSRHAFFGRARRRPTFRLTLVIVLCVSATIYVWPKAQNSLLCDLFPDPGNIAIAVKTGATEPEDKLLPILRTSLSCAQNVMLLSDVEDAQGRYPTHDVLSFFSPDIIEQNNEFELYRQIRSLKASGLDEELDRLRNAPIPESANLPPGKGAGWVLDKYKFLHLVDAAHHLKPDKQWYVFLEVDTYLSWPNLLRWLPSLDANAALFLGNAIEKNADSGAPFFAQGGSGFVLSGDVVKGLASQKLPSKWDSRAHKWNAGDFLFADFVHQELGLSVTNAWPAFNEHNTTGIAYTQSTWCDPVITLHHVAGTAFDTLFGYEKHKRFSQFLRSDAFYTGFSTDFTFPTARQDWDNFSEAREHRVELEDQPHAHANVTTCQLACEAIDDCFQFLFRNTTMSTSDTGGMHECILSSAFRLGQPKPQQPLGNVREPQVARSWISGWNSRKIQDWMARQEPCRKFE